MGVSEKCERTEFVARGERDVMCEAADKGVAYRSGKWSRIGRGGLCNVLLVSVPVWCSR